MNRNDLRKALDGARPALEAALAEAQLELEQLDERRDELMALIVQVRAALGLSLATSPKAPKGERALTLHEAVAQVLREHGNAWMTARDLVQEVNERNLYRKRDGSPVELNQIHARTKNYANIFEKDGSRIRLRDA